MINITEEEIMKNWGKDLSLPIISICCITYNHEKYIEEALDGFLSQDTNFVFEILVDDDCSIDQTRNIILKYQKKYPHIIKSFLRKKNVGSMSNFIENLQRAKGQYIAICEGDDYWTDKKKLQIQISEMQKNPEVNLSFHSAKELKDDEIGKEISVYSSKNKIVTINEVILGRGEFCPTASIVIKKKVVDNIPSWIQAQAPIGDYFLQIFGSLEAGALYINKSMSIYRVNSFGSWSSSIQDINKTEKFINNLVVSLNLLDNHLKFKYQLEIEHMKSQYYYSLAKSYLLSKMYKNFKDTITLCYKIDNNSFQYKLFYYGRNFPNLLIIISMFRQLYHKFTEHIYYLKKRNNKLH